MSAKLVLRVEWNETVRTFGDPFNTKKFSNLSPEILVEWIALYVVRAYSAKELNNLRPRLLTSKTKYTHLLSSRVIVLSVFLCVISSREQGSFVVQRALSVGKDA